MAHLTSTIKGQISIILCFVQAKDGCQSEVCEHFLTLISVMDTTGAGLTEQLLSILEDCPLPLSECRGQGYNGR